MRVREVLLVKGDAHLHLDLDAGGRATALGIGDLDVIAHPDPGSPFGWGSFVMAPWAGRVKDGRFTADGQPHQLDRNAPPHAIHGTVADRPWWCVEHTETEAVIDCPFDDRWPWRGFVRQVVSLTEDSASFRVEVHADDAVFPAVAGWHPWFPRQLPRGEPLRLTLDAEAALARDETNIPTGERIAIPPEPWDDCFDTVRWPITLSWPRALDLDVTADTRFAVVFTEPADAVCVEPQTGPPDGLTGAATLVSPSEPLTAEMTWRWRTS